jgi:hypothetical protein
MQEVYNGRRSRSKNAFAQVFLNINADGTGTAEFRMDMMPSAT